MNRTAGRLSLLSFLLIPLIGFSADLSETDLVEKANAAWNQRAEPGKTEECVQDLEKAVEISPERGDLYILLTRAYGRLYRRMENPAEKRRLITRAKETGERAISLEAENADAYYEYAAALGQWAETQGMLKALKTVKRAFQYANRAVELNPRQPFAHMFLSELYREVPGWPVAFGSKQEALRHARLAVTYGGQYPITHLSLAKILMEMGREEEAAQEVSLIESLSAPADYVPETASEKEKAKELLVKIKRPASQ